MNCHPRWIRSPRLFDWNHEINKFIIFLKESCKSKSKKENWNKTCNSILIVSIIFKLFLSRFRFSPNFLHSFPMNEHVGYAIKDLENGANEISFYCKELSDGELAPFFQKLESNKTIKRLDLDDNLIESCTDITNFLKNNTTLTQLSLNNNMFGEMGSIEILKAIQHHPSLKTLELDNNTWTDCMDIDIESIVPALVQNTTLTHLSLSECRIFQFSNGLESCSTIIEQNKTLLHMELNDNSIGNRGATRLAEALQKNTSLESLRLWHNKIGNTGALAIAKMLFTNSTLLRLELGGNNIGPEGCKDLAQALQYNTSLTRLGLEECKISCEGAMELATMLQTNTTLLTLDVGNNNIKTRGIQALAHALCINTTLTDMDMNSCDPENQGVQSIIQVFRQNQTLKRFDIWGIPMDEKEIEMLSDALSTNYSLHSIGKVLAIPHLNRNERLFCIEMGWKTKMNRFWSFVVQGKNIIHIESEFRQIKNQVISIKKQKEINKNEK
jgi:Ran GTPase-activating protein (RanGAP) involved in mRNA processing and transport